MECIRLSCRCTCIHIVIFDGSTCRAQVTSVLNSDQRDEYLNTFPNLDRIDSCRVEYASPLGASVAMRLAAGGLGGAAVVALAVVGWSWIRRRAWPTVVVDGSIDDVEDS